MLSTQDIIKKLRRRGYSQMRLGDATGIPQARISRWENGKVPNAAEDALKLFALLQEEEAADSAARDKAICAQ